MNSLKHLNKYLIKYKYRLLLGFLFIILANFFKIFPAQLIREALNLIQDKLSGNAITNTSFLAAYLQDMPTNQIVLLYACIIFGIAIITGIFTFFQRQTIIVMSRLIEYDLKNEIFNHYQKLDMRFYKENNTGDIMNRISDDVLKARMYLGPAMMYSFGLVTLFLMIVPVMFSINVKLSLYSLTPLPILSIIIYMVSARINRQSERVQSKLSDITTLSQETYAGIRIIKTYVKKRFFAAKLNSENESYHQRSMDLVKTNALFFPVMMLLIGLSTIFTIYIGGTLLIEDANNPLIPEHEKIKIGEILSFVIYINMLTWPVTAIGWVTSIVQRAAASQTRINAFLNTHPKVKNTCNAPLDLNEDIAFNNVSFAYPESGIVALRNISFTIKKGETLAIVGKTGSGKSTIINLLMRNYDVDEGAIMIGNKNLKDINLNQLREKTGIVPQDVFLFSDTIENNIAFGYKNELPSPSIIEKAAKNAAIYDNIMNLPEGFKTKIGERGVTLSGGQKQRISIARAIIKNPDLLIFDDCLSAVDTKTEDVILNNLKQLMHHKTSIIISHSISSVKTANHILVLDEGKITEQGTHQELLNLKGNYYETYQTQLLAQQKQD